MLQALSTLACIIVVVKGDDSSAQRDVYQQQAAKSDWLRYYGRPTPRPTSRRYDVQAQGDGYPYRTTKRPTSQYLVKSDGYYGPRPTRRPTSRRYAEADEVKSDGWFRRYFRPTRRPTARRYDVEAKSNGYYRRPTPRPTSRYAAQVRSDRYVNTPRPTSRRYDMKQAKMYEPVGNVGADTQAMVPEPKMMDKKYFHVKARMGWNDAQEACAKRGAQLAVIHSADEHERVARACQGECWIGADRSDAAASFKWSDESRMDFENWKDKTDDDEKSGLCGKMTMSVDKKWASADCADKLGFVCQTSEWDGSMQASVDESNVFGLGMKFGSANVLSAVFTVLVVVVVGFLACNYVCLATTDKKGGWFAKRVHQRGDETEADETSPLLGTST